ncbi:hypothetical protein GCM10022284_21490 [Streptomyces hundungensis]
MVGGARAGTPARHRHATTAQPVSCKLFTSKSRTHRTEVNDMKVYTKPEAKQVEQGTIVATVR